jgi:HAMP domain-containing protein
MADDAKKPEKKPPTVAPIVPPTKAPIVQPVVQPVVQPMPAPVVKPMKAPAKAAKEKEAEPEEDAESSIPQSKSRATDRLSGYTGAPVARVVSAALVLLTFAAATFAWNLARTAAAGAIESVDADAEAAARLLAAGEYEWWSADHGTAADMRKRAQDTLAQKELDLKTMADGPAKEELKALVEGAKGKLFTTFLADRKEDEALKTRNRERLRKLAKKGAIVGVDLYDSNRRPLNTGGPMPQVDRLEADGDLVRGTFSFAAESGATFPGRLCLAPIVGESAQGGPRLLGYAGVALSAEAAAGFVARAEKKGLVAGGAVLTLGLLGAFVAFFMLARVRPILRDAEEFSRGNFEHRPSTPGGGEVGALGRAVARMALAAKDKEREALAKSTGPAAATVDNRPVVAAGLAPAAPLRLPGWEIEGTSRACFAIAGDFFDYSPAAGGRLSCILVETSLRGLPAAFLSAELRGLYRGLAPAADSASVLLDSLGAAVGPRVPEGEEVHATIALVDPASGKGEIARAGKANPPVAWRAETKGLEKIEIEGPPIRKAGGAGTGAAAGSVEVTLNPRDRLSLVSDGLFGARNQRKEKFGEQRLDGLVLKFGPMNSTAFVNMVVNEVDLFHEGAAQVDDLAIVTIRRIK